jgi:hypothetical protein
MWSNECKWISDDAFTNQAYEAIKPSPSDTCVPCSDPNDCGPYIYDDPKVEQSPGGLLAFVDMIKDNWDDRVSRAIIAGTLGLEKFAGTYLLPSNKVNHQHQMQKTRSTFVLRQAATKALPI